MSNNEFCLGTIKDGKMVSVHVNGFPVKYWPDGPGTYSGEPGWYYYDPDGGDEGFCNYIFDESPWDWPIVQVYDTDYRSLVLLVVVPYDPITDADNLAVCKPYTGEQVKKFLAGWEQ